MQACSASNSSSRVREQPHQVNVPVNFGSLLGDTVFSDITLVVGESSFRAHRAILAASSTVFKQMFSGGFKESKQKKVVLEEVKSDTVGDLLKFIYTGKLALTEENAWDIFKLADQFLVTPLTSECASFLKTHISMWNISTFIENSRKYDSYGFEKAAIDFITLQFDDYFLLDMESELHYLTFDMLLNVITSDTLLLSCEMKVLEAIKIWGKEDDDETVAKHLKGGKKCKMNPREQHVPKLLQQVRFPLMSASQLHQVENDADVMKYSIMKDLLIEAWKARAKDPPLDPANPRYQKRKYLFSLSRKKKCTKN